MRPVVLVHLYPRELGINGDRGNVTALAARARWRGIPLEVHDVHPGDGLPAHVDLVHIGSGPVSGQQAVYPALTRIADRLRGLHADGVPFLAVAAGWQLLGTELVTTAGERFDGVGIFPSSTTLTRHRAVGEVVLRTDDGVVTGFENHSAATTLDAGAAPFGTVQHGAGNAAPPRTEGVRTGESIGTTLHGPLLPMNPAVADRLLSAAVRIAGGDPAEWASSPPAELASVDEFAARSREAIIQRTRIARAR